MVVEDYIKRPETRVGIIRIIRGEKIINIPKLSESVYEGDIIHMIGTEHEVDVCTMLLEEDERIEYTDKDDITLKKYIELQDEDETLSDSLHLMCVPISITPKSQFARRMIKQTNIRKKYRATIIGIERENLPIIKPDKETIIRSGDLLWVLGSRRMVDELIKSDMMKNQ
jgi:CPA2 family monovalent cation:H+ antiporter-2